MFIFAIAGISVSYTCKSKLLVLHEDQTDNTFYRVLGQRICLNSKQITRTYIRRYVVLCTIICEHACKAILSYKIKAAGSPK